MQNPKPLNPPQNLTQIYRSQVRFILLVCLINVIGVSISALTVYLPMVYQSNKIDDTTQLAVIGLLALHAGLHAFSLRIARRRRLAILYLLVQFSVLCVVSYLATYPVFLTVFIQPLLAETLVIFEIAWLVLPTIALGYGLFVVQQLILFSIYSPGLAQSGALLPALIQGVLMGLWAISTQIAASFILLRSRRETGSLLVKLDQAHRQLAVYAEQVEQLTVAAERARMARELHDTLAQGVVGLIMQLEALDAQIGRGDTKTATTTLTQIKERARTTLKGSRQAIDDLRAAQKESGLISSNIAQEARNFSTLTGIPCSLDIPPALVLPTSTTEHSIRFISEGLANVAKHARASSVSVRVKPQERDVVLEVQDDGIGFDAASAPPGHYGLLGLQERARLVGGKFEVVSVPGQGTTLRLYLPKLN